MVWKEGIPMYGQGEDPNEDCRNTQPHVLDTAGTPGGTLFELKCGALSTVSFRICAFAPC